MDEFVARLTEYMEMAEGAIVGVAPEVWDTTLTIIHFQGILWAIGATLMLCVVAAYWLFVFKRLRAIAQESYDKAFSKGVLYIFSSIGSAFLAIIACSIWFLNVDTWLSLIEPKAALVYRVGQSVGIF